MKYLSNAVNFTIKNWMLIIPLFVLMALASLFGSTSSALSLASLTPLARLDNFSDVGSLFSLVPKVAASMAGGGIVAFLVQFVYNPATYGLVNKGIETGHSSISDIGAAISSNLVKYIMYFVGTIVVTLVLSIATLILLVILVLLVSVLKTIGVILLILVGLALGAFFIAFGSLTSLWYSAMVVDGLDVVTAFKKSIETVKGCFWTVLGVTVLIGVLSSLAGSLLGFIFGRIPLLGPIITSAVPAVSTFVTIVFSLLVYRENTSSTAV